MKGLTNWVRFSTGEGLLEDALLPDAVFCETPLDELLFCELFRLVLTTTPRNSATTMAARMPNAARRLILRTIMVKVSLFPI